MSSLLTRKPNKTHLLLLDLAYRLEQVEETQQLILRELQPMRPLLQNSRERLVLVEELLLETASSLRPPPELVIAEKLGLPPQRFQPTGPLPPPASHPASQS